MTSRTYNNTTATLSYDNQDHLTEWNAGASSQEWYLYDAGGQRVLRRSINSTGTSLTVYAFGLEEHVYSSTGSNQGNTYYYTLAGKLLGTSDGQSGTFYQTDLLGSVVADWSNTAGSAALKGNEVYGPYGKERYNQGTHGTSKGFTGQYGDWVSGLDYYNARYYDPKAGVFLSADSVQGNESGENPYAYVGGNPETYTDPTGEIPLGPGPTPAPAFVASAPASAPVESPPPVPVPLIACSLMCLGIAGLLAVALTLATPQTVYTGDYTVPVITAPFRSRTWAEVYGNGSTGGATAISIQPHQNTPASASPTPLPQAGGSGSGIQPPRPVSAPGAPCSFTSDTPVTTNHGEQAISKLHVGDKVLAYNPKTHKMELQPILHVWTHTDNDLVDLVITTTPAQHGKSAKHKTEVMHTTSEHPFFTTEQGFVAAGKVKMGMHVLRADEGVGVITGWKLVLGTKVMYNLEVAQDHTFTVGDGQWVVHNRCDPSRLGRRLNQEEKFGLPDQNPHHVIPCALENHPPIQATNGRYDIDAAYNGRWMWPKSFRTQALGDMEPYHGNAPRYRQYVESLMDEKYQGLVNSGTLSSGTAFDSLMGITNQLNNWIDILGWFGALQGEACGLSG